MNAGGEHALDLAREGGGWGGGREAWPPLQIQDVTCIQVEQNEAVWRCSEVTQASQKTNCKYLLYMLDFKLQIFGITLHMCICVLHNTA